VDTVIAALEEVAARRLRAENQKPPSEWVGLARHERCTDAACNTPLDRLSGYYQFGHVGGEFWFHPVRPRTRLLTRTAILEELESPRPQALFGRAALDAGQEFAGFLDIASPGEATLTRLLSPGTELQVGAGRTAGLGRMEVVDLQPDWGALANLLGPVTERQQAFNAQLCSSLRERWAFVSLTLLSDTILMDNLLRYTSAPEPDVLRHYAVLEARTSAVQQVTGHANGASGTETDAPAVNALPDWPAGTELFLAMVRTKRVAGWNTVAGTDRPRSDDLALVAGSVFVLAAPPDQADDLLKACAWLEEHRLGERREEGFGQVVVAHPFHREKMPT
jgi:hypothetical protein